MIIGIAGISASGKTTLCLQLIQHLPDARLIHLDDYWHLDRIPVHHGVKNWELPQNLDFSRLAGVLAALRAGKTAHGLKVVREPGQRSRQEDAIIEPADIVIVEGFLLLYDPHVRELLDIKVYLDIDEETSVRRRLARKRSARDDAEHYYRQYVVKEYARHGLPTRIFADIVLDATMQVEENVQMVLAAIRRRENA